MAAQTRIGCKNCGHGPERHQRACSAKILEGPGDERFCGCTDYRPWVYGDLQDANRRLRKHLVGAEVPDHTPEAAGDTTEGRGAAFPYVNPEPGLPPLARYDDHPGLAEQEGRGDAFEELAAWWRDYAETEIRGVVPKAVEYGSGDLAAIGRNLARLMGRSPVDDREAVELGIYFYVVGKLARWTDAVEHNRDTSDDTLHDLAVYVKMAIRNRYAGGWPGSNPHLKEKLT